MVARTIYNVGVSLFQRAIHPNREKALNGVGFIRPHVWKARCGLLDVGLDGKMDQASATLNLENARWSFGFLSGGVQHAIKNKWMFVAGFNTMNMFEEIPLGKAYEIHSYVVYWEKEAGWWFFDHTFICPDTGKILANGMTRVLLRDMKIKERICMPEYLAVMKVSCECPEMPDTVKRYLELDDETRFHMEAWRGKEELQSSSLDDIPVEIASK
ncbi:hypothetical protein AC1031_018898 [Aphanomyces cochlioides]|nr:hypothetical protein AC1031_018898 [Aphanomyces cochlioides]